MHLPAEWQQAADHIVAQARPGLRVMVVGATDTGKSTFCRYLASCLIQAGAEVGLVDADVGQSTIGPPAAISGGLVARSIEALAQVEPAASVFVGSISPMGHLLPCVVGTKETYSQPISVRVGCLPCLWRVWPGVHSAGRSAWWG